MKNIFLILLFLLLVSCNNEEETFQCPDPLGNLRADIGGGFTFDGRFTEFVNRDEDLILLSSESVSLGCISTGSLLIFLEKQIGEQELTRFLASDTSGPGETIFFDFEDDLILARFELLEEGDNNVIEITSLDEKSMEGTFSATYVHDAGPMRFTQLPDTLRFVNVSFRAEFFEQQQ